jgi:hypothetical protein
MTKPLPPPPVNIGKRRVHTSIDGRPVAMTVEDEICRLQASSRSPKLIYFQKFRFEEDRRIEYRFTYYMLGVKPGARGRWVFGQYSLLIPGRDLAWFLRQARERGWPHV